MAADRGDLSLLTLLDLSAAFDMMNHDILLQILCISHGIDDLALDWFNKYLTDRYKSVLFGGESITAIVVEYGVSQGLMLGPLLFLLWTSAILRIIDECVYSV